MKIQKTTLSIILLILTMVVIVVLSTGLSSLELKPGQSYLFPSEKSQTIKEVKPFTLFDFGEIWQILGLLAIWVILPLSVIYFLISPDARRRILKRALSLSISMSALFFLARWLATTGGCATIQTATSLPEGSSGGEIAEFIFTPKETPSFRVLGSFLLAIVVASLAYRVWQRIRLRRPKQIDKIAQEAENAVTEIQAGADLRDAIKRCYFEMSKALQKYHNVQRNAGMTPREFETSLYGMGLPIGNVHRLTLLFEEVRYGSKVLGESAEKEAINLLNAIVQDCREQK